MSEKRLYEGTARGGPVDSQVMSSRCPRGILLVSKPYRKVWIYDWVSAEGVFHMREERDMIDDPDAPKNRYRAADEGEYDVQAVPDLEAHRG